MAEQILTERDIAVRALANDDVPTAQAHALLAIVDYLDDICHELQTIRSRLP